MNNEKEGMAATVSKMVERVDTVSQNNICQSKIDKLKEVTINQL